MKSSGLGASAASLILSTLFLTVAGCGGGGGSGSGSSSSGPMYIQTCSLGCSSGQAGAQVSCALVSTHVNQDIAIYFSQPVDPASLNSTSVNVVDVNTGAVPPGLCLIDPSNPNKVIFRPTITFDTIGNATFGFTDNHTYRIVVPGQEQGDAGPFVRSQGGKSNQSRMQCEIQTSLGVVDLVPGAPLADVRVDQAITSTPNPNDTIPNVEAQGATDVWHNSTIRFSFNDVMNPATLAANGQATFITIKVDLDGDVSTTTDRVPLTGTYVVHQDTVALTSSLVFTATNGIPSSGNPLINPALRKIVVTLPPDLRDLAGNPLGNPEVVAFTPEFVALGPVVLPDADGENFTDQTNYDASKSSAEWSGGKLTRGFGGGSGRLGQLFLRGTDVRTLNTDSQDFPLPDQLGVGQTSHDILDNLLPGVDYFPGHPENGPELPGPLTVTDGTFEFSVLSIEPNARLILTGSKPARLFSRGAINMQGIIDLSGQSAAVHAGDVADGGSGGVGGPNAGSGGKGATRADNTNPQVLLAGGIDIDETMITLDPNGSPGGGVGNVGTLAAGLGGIHNPDDFPTGIAPPNLGPTATVSNTAAFDCRFAQVGSPGGGGAYATDGNSSGGHVDPQLPGGHARAECGGCQRQQQFARPGRGWTFERPSHRASRRSAGHPPARRGEWSPARRIRRRRRRQRHVRQHDQWILRYHFARLCDRELSGQFWRWWRRRRRRRPTGDGPQLVRVRIDRCFGRRRRNQSASARARTDARTVHGPPGGSGSGGAVRLQGQTVDLVGTTQVRVDVSGGTGGANYNGSHGGNGGAGLVRLETSLIALDPAAEAAFVGPQDAAIVGPNAQNVLSVGNWVLPRRRPESFTGAMSCWMKPTASGAFQILFREDDVTNPDPTLQYGWNMDIVYDAGQGQQLIKFRGPDPNLPFPTSTAPDFEHFLGNTLNYGVPAGTGSYLAVRFQGVQIIGSFQPCTLSLNPSDNQVLSNSLTPWVRHPSDLNDFNPKPNAVRFSVVFDTSLVTPSSIPFFIKGVTNLKILAQPD